MNPYRVPSATAHNPLWILGFIGLGLVAFTPISCKPGQAGTVVDAGVAIAKIVACVDADLQKGMAPIAVAVDCGLKDAAEVEALVGASERLAAHRRARGRDAGTD
jgi:hypothetical protein